MKSVFVIETFYRKADSQLTELYSLSRDAQPDEIWVLGRAETQVPDIPGTASRLLVCPNGEQESWLRILCAEASENSADIYLLPSDIEGRMMAARLACRLEGSAFSAVCSYTAVSDRELHVERACYNGHMKALFSAMKFPVLLSAVPSSAARSFKYTMPGPEELRVHNAGDCPGPELSVRPRPSAEGLHNAECVVAAGLGVRNTGEIQRCRELAEKLGAYFAASRPVVMNGWVPEEAMLGVSGNVISPRLCLTLGVSGSGAFMTGIQDSKKIVAVNTDTHAPIFKNSDLGAELDCMELVEEMIKILDEKAASK